MPGKRVQFDDASWHALAQFAKDRMQDFQELADEAFADLRSAGKSLACAGSTVLEPLPV